MRNIEPSVEEMIVEQLVAGIIQESGRRLAKNLESPERRRALLRCAQAGVAALLKEVFGGDMDEELQQHLEGVLRGFAEDQILHFILADAICSGRLPEHVIEGLEERFREVHARTVVLARFDVERAVAAFLGGFVDQADQEEPFRSAGDEPSDSDDIEESDTGDLAAGDGLRGDEDLPPPPPAKLAEPVCITSSVPEAVRPGDRFKVDIVLHSESYVLEEQEGRIVQQGEATLAIGRGTRLALRLVPVEEGAFTLDDPEATLKWTPPLQQLDFLLKVRQGLPDGLHHLRLETWCEGVQLARIYLEIAIDTDAPKQQRSRPRIRKKLPRSAFASYSRQDRVRVADRVEALLGVGIDVFMDCLDIKPAEKWQEVLEDELLSREVLLLFWSSHARDSEWVEREWRFALARHRDDQILPNALEPPAVCPPPEELAHLQFGSVLTELRSAWQA